MIIQPAWMRLIHDTSSGKMVLATPKIAGFKGTHNSCKSKALIVLYHRVHTLHQTTGLSLKALSIASGVSYAYLKSRLGRWSAWKYVTRKIGESPGGPIYLYAISKRGEHFVEDRIPRDVLSRYIAEIKASQAKQPIKTK